MWWGISTWQYHLRRWRPLDLSWLFSCFVVPNSALGILAVHLLGGQRCEILGGMFEGWIFWSCEVDKARLRELALKYLGMRYVASPL